MSLSQLFFDGKSPLTEFNKNELTEASDLIWLHIKSKLQEHRKPNHFYIKPNQVIDHAQALVSSCKVYKFNLGDIDTYNDLSEMFFNHDVELRLPSQEALFEWRGVHGNLEGVFFRKLDGQFLAFILSNQFSKRDVYPLSCIMFSITSERKMKIKCVWSILDRNGVPKGDLCDYEFDVIDLSIVLMAALNVERATEAKPVVWEPALQRSRIKRGLSPLISYNEVKLKVPKLSIVRDEGRRSKIGPGVRLHDVVGHHKSLTANGSRIVRWIDPYFRGDARLGVVYKRRSIVT